MPIYEYRCTACGHQQEFLQKVSDAPLSVCTQCGKESFSKMVTAAGFQLKGSGWYATDFKSKGATPKSDAKPDAKPDAKTESKPGSGSAEGGSSSGGSGSEGGKQAAPAGCGGNCACH